jgi:NitT/TauT family transport system ATP-binding protein
MIRFESVTKKFDSQTVFENLNLDIPLNRTTVLSGPSGSGKTTMLRMIAGLDRDYTGSVTGVPDTISFMFQEDRLLPWKDVKGNIEFVLKDIMDKTEIDTAIKKIIDGVQLTGHENKKPSELSGGMKRRVALARAFCYPSKLVILDEPFNGLDAQLKNDMAGLFDRLFIKTGKTAIIVTHDTEVINDIECELIDIGKIRET